MEKALAQAAQGQAPAQAKAPQAKTTEEYNAYSALFKEADLTKKAELAEKFRGDPGMDAVSGVARERESRERNGAAAARAGAGTHFDQAQGAGDFQLLTEARHANTQLAAQLIERGQAAFCFRVRSQVAEELGEVSRGAFS